VIGQRYRLVYRGFESSTRKKNTCTFAQTIFRDEVSPRQTRCKCGMTVLDRYMRAGGSLHPFDGTVDAATTPTADLPALNTSGGVRTQNVTLLTVLTQTVVRSYFFPFVYESVN